MPFGHLGGYPLIVGNSVIISVPASKQLWALDLHTGATLWGPVNFTTTMFGGPADALTYENGQIFALNGGGTLEAYDVSSGARNWSVTLPSQTSFTAPPTAHGGMVFVSGAGVGGTVYGVDQANGHVLWTQFVENGDGCSPTVTKGGVFVSYACNQSYRFDPGTGAVSWHHQGPCEGGGGQTASLHDGLLYSLDTQQNVTLDEFSGAPVGSFTASVPPVFHGGTGYFLQYGTLSAIDLATQVTRWTFKPALMNPNDGVVTVPLVVGGRVFVGTEYGTLFGVDEATGAVTFTDEIHKPFDSITTFYSWLNGLSITSFASAQGVIAVATSSDLIVYGPPSASDGGTGDSE
jgi:outer membrane protein assembly factor BamB